MDRIVSNRMKGRTFIIGCALALALLVFGQRYEDVPEPHEFHAVVDLTHSVESSSFEISGTHLDAPSQFAPSLWSADQIPAERLVAPLVVLDATTGAHANPDYQVSLDDISKWEQANGSIPLNSVVIARTGWDSRWDSSKDYRNADAKGVMHFPGFSLEAAKFLVEGRSALGLGIDTLSIDYGPSKDFPVRRYALAHSVYQLESVANLDRAPVEGGIAVVAPAKLEGGSGAPVRLFALAR
jgi:kynurenine formamidase